jgi:hypothetical protein
MPGKARRYSACPTLVMNAADDDITAVQINPGLKAPECGKDVTP